MRITIPKIPIADESTSTSWVLDFSKGTIVLRSRWYIRVVDSSLVMMMMMKQSRTLVLNCRFNILDCTAIDKQQQTSAFVKNI